MMFISSCPEYESMGAYEEDNSEPEIPIVPAIPPPAPLPLMTQAALPQSSVRHLQDRP